MSLETPYDQENIFAKIIAGDIPCVKIFESDDILAFMDVFPQSNGHCLVIHKKAQAVNLLDLEPDDLSNIIVHVQKTANAVKKALKPDGIRIAQFNGAAAGQTVFHTHFHIIPAYESGVERPHAAGKPADTEALKEIAAKITQAL